jgi:nucleotide-binding universal stress UspA family protein
MDLNLLKFRTIALATDLTDASSSALRYAQAVARMYRSTLVLIYVRLSKGCTTPLGGERSRGRRVGED